MRAMKDSGVEWLGNIPTDWDVKRVGSLFRERKRQVSAHDFTALSVTKHGVVPQLDSAAKSDATETRKLIKEGDFVINSRSDRKGSSGLAPTDGSCSSIYIVLEPRGLEGRFAHQLFRSQAFQEEFFRWGTGIVDDLWSTRYASMKMISVPVPPKGEVASIISYLEQETSQIDLLISKKKQLIEKLLERRQALITQAVTKGLDPNVPMKDSGVEWIGLLPQDWKIGRLRHLVTFHNGREITKGESGEFPVYGSGGIFAWSDKVQNSAENWSVLFGRKGSIDKPLLVQGPFSCVDTMYWTTVSPEADPRFVHFVAQSLPYAAVATQTALPSMTSSALKGLRVPIPTLSNQIAIATKLENETSAINSLIGKAQGAVQLLKERRQALITQVVTGKLDVRGFAGGNS